MLNVLGRFNPLAEVILKHRRADDGSDSHFISIKTSARVHENVGCDIEPVDVDYNCS